MRAPSPPSSLCLCFCLNLPKYSLSPLANLSDTHQCLRVRVQKAAAEAERERREKRAKIEQQIDELSTQLRTTEADLHSVTREREIAERKLDGIDMEVKQCQVKLRNAKNLERDASIALQQAETALESQREWRQCGERSSTVGRRKEGKHWEEGGWEGRKKRKVRKGRNEYEANTREGIISVWFVCECE